MCFGLSFFFFLKDAYGCEQKQDVVLELLNKCSALDTSGVDTPHFPLQTKRDPVWCYGSLFYTAVVFTL